MGKVAGFLKKTRIALRKMFIDPLKTGITDDRTVFQNAVTGLRNISGVLSTGLSLASTIFKGVSALFPNPITKGLEKLTGVGSLVGTAGKAAFDYLDDGHSDPYLALQPSLEYLSKFEFGKAYDQAKQFVDEVNQEFDQLTKQNNSFQPNTLTNADKLMSKYGQKVINNDQFPDPHSALYPSARTNLFNPQRPHRDLNSRKVQVLK